MSDITDVDVRAARDALEYAMSIKQQYGRWNNVFVSELLAELTRLRAINAKLLAACNHSKSVLIQVSEQQCGLIADHGDCLDELIVAIRDAEGGGR